MRIFYFFGKNINNKIQINIEVKTLITCPLCKKNTVGKVGSNQYYCLECFVEFLIQKDKTTIYEVSDDGTLLPYEKDKQQLTMGN